MFSLTLKEIGPPPQARPSFFERLRDRLAVRRAAEHDPLEGEQLGSGRQFDFCLAAKACAIEADCFLREPGESRAVAGFEPGYDARGLVQDVRPAVLLVLRRRHQRYPFDGSTVI